MQREEAEAEAERRNRDDPKAARFEFYALDESAGLADDAWDVGIRLRPGGSTAPGVTPSVSIIHRNRRNDCWSAVLAPDIVNALR